jgi:hypothetical protein
MASPLAGTANKSAVNKVSMVTSVSTTFRPFEFGVKSCEQHLILASSSPLEFRKYFQAEVT